MNKKLFGRLDSGDEIYTHKIENGEICAEIITFGAAIKSFRLASENEKNIVAGFDTLEQYIEDDSHQGAVIGRVANRIADAKFTLDGVTYTLPKNDGKNCLHGGCGFDRRVWTVTEHTSDSVTLTYTSADGEEGFPAELTVYVTYTCIDSALLIEYRAYPKAKTPIALTNHAYFNLDGLGDTVYNHKIKIYADKYSEVDDALIPTGNHPDVSGSVFDLREPKSLRDAVKDGFFGYDHNFLLSPTEFSEFKGKRLGLAAVAFTDTKRLSTYTDMKNIQFYMGNFLSGEPDFEGGVKKVGHGAFCLETQTEPNAVNHGIGIYGKDEVYTHTTAYVLEKI